MPVAAWTAEWTCTICGATNRKLISTDTTATTDRCLHCGAVHRITAGTHPSVRWQAVLK